MKRDCYRLFKYIKFLKLVTVLQIQITEIVIVKLNSNCCRRASFALGVHGIFRVLLFKFKHKATIKELDKNLVGKNGIDMLPAKSDNHDMMKMSLAYLMLLKRKRWRKIKASDCANDRSQRKYITKLESNSPCVETHALFLSWLVGEFKQRCVIIADVPGVFPSAD